MRAEVDFQPVVLGSDIGTYALARCFHEAYGVRSVVIARKALGPIRDSHILDIRLVDEADAPNPDSKTPFIDLVAQMGPQLKEEFPGKKLLLVANTDSFVWEIVTRADALREHYVFAFPNQELLEATNDKARFPQQAAAAGLTVPETLTLNLQDGLEAVQDQVAQAEMRLPWIIKPAFGYGYETLHWPGKKKVYTAQSAEEAQQIFAELDAATADQPQARRFVMQPRIEGNDTFNLSVTAYVDSRGEVTMLGSAQVLLEDHSPTALGNPAAMITERYPQLYQQVKRFFAKYKWHGFANFDVKVDRVDGRPYFFEVNPRIGRNCYYNAAAGMNPVKFLVADVIEGRAAAYQEIPEHALYTVLPKHLLLRYINGAAERKVRYLYRIGRVANPLFYAAERANDMEWARRESYVRLATLNHFRKYHRNFPVSELEKVGADSFDTRSLL